MQYYSDFVLKIYHLLQCATASSCHLIHLIENVYNQLKLYIPDTYELAQNESYTAWKKDLVLMTTDKEAVISKSSFRENWEKQLLTQKIYICIYLWYSTIARDSMYLLLLCFQKSSFKNWWLFLINGHSLVFISLD